MRSPLLRGVEWWVKRKTARSSGRFTDMSQMSLELLTYVASLIAIGIPIPDRS
jgi:hypothetical protein